MSTPLRRLRRLRGRTAMLGAMASGLLLALPATVQAFTAQPFTPTTEAQNFSKVEERQTIYDTPG